MSIVNSTSFCNKWTIENFSHFYLPENLHTHPFIHSPNISQNDSFNACIELCPTGEDESCVEYVSLFLNFESRKEVARQIEIWFKISLVGANRKYDFVREQAFCMDKSKRIGWPKFVSQKYLQTSKCLQNDKLVIHCEIRLIQLTIEAKSKHFVNFPNLNYSDNWTVPKFKSLLTNCTNSTQDQILQSSNFTPTTEDEYQMYLILKPVSEQDPDNVALFLRLEKCSKQQIFLRFSASILDATNREEKFFTRTCTFKIDRRERCGWHQFASRQQLLISDNIWNNDDLIIHYEVEIFENQGQNSEILLSKEQEFATDSSISMIPFTHRWSIEEFSKYLLRNELELNFLESKQFHSPIDDTRVEFYIRIETKSPSEHEQNYLSLYLWCNAHRQQSVKVYFRLSILDKFDKKFLAMGSQIEFNSESIDNFGWHFVSVADLISNSNNLLCDDKFSVLCEIELIDALNKSFKNYLESPSWFFGGAVLSKYSHKWTIDDFSIHLDRGIATNAAICSENFSIQNNQHNEVQFYLRLYPNFHDQHVAVHLCCASNNEGDVLVSYRVTFVDGNQPEKPFNRATFKRGNEDNAYVEKISREDLTHKISLGEDRLIICCEINAIEIAAHNPNCTINDYYTEVERRKLSTAYETKSVTNRANYSPNIFSHNWTIANVHQRFDQSSLIESGKIQFPQAENLEFNFKLQLSGEFVSLHLEVYSREQDREEVTIRWKTFILDFNEDEQNFKGGRWRYMLSNESRMSTWGWPQWITYSELFDESSGFVNRNQLVIRLEIEMFIPEPQNPENPTNNSITSLDQGTIRRDPSNTCSYTRICKAVHHWTLDNFSCHLDTTHEKHPLIESSPVTLLIKDDLRFKLCFYPFSCKDEPNDDLWLFLCLTSSDQKDEDVIVQCKMSILNKDEQKFKTIYAQLKFEAVNMSFGWTKLGTRAELFDHVNDLLVKDQLKIYSEIYLIQSETSPIKIDKFAISDFATENWKTIPLNHLITTNVCQTKLPIFPLSKQWTIDHFKEKCKHNFIKVFDPFSQPENENLQFHLKAKMNQNESENQLAIYFCLNYQIEQEIKLRLRVSLLDKDRHQFDLKENKVKLPQHEDSFETVEYFSIKSILNSENNLLPGDKLIILSEVVIIEKHITISSESPESEYTILPSLNKHLEPYQPADLVLQWKNGDTQTNKLYAHKSVLSAQSKFFQAKILYESELQNHKSLIQLQDFNAEIGAELLRYIYTGRILRMEEFAVEYFIAADFYDLDQLYAECKEWINAHRVEFENLAKNHPNKMMIELTTSVNNTEPVVQNDENEKDVR